MSKVKSKALKLLESASDEEASLDSLSAIIEIHSHCLAGNFCEECEYLSDESEGLLLVLAQNPKLSHSMQSQLQASSIEAGQDVDFLLCLAGNSNVSDDFKALILSDAWYGFGEGADLVIDALKEMIQNPTAFTADEIRKFIKDCQDNYGFYSDDEIVTRVEG